MVAETLTGTRAAAGFPVFSYHASGVLQVAYGSYAVAANVEDGDIFEMCKIPGGSTVLGGYLYGDVLDGHATETLDMDIGWAANGVEAADADGLGNLGVWTGDAVADLKPEVGIFFPLAGKLITEGPLFFTNETTIQIEANAAAATFAAGPMFMVVFYVTG